MYSGIPAQQINSAFFTKSATSEGREKMGQMAGTYVRDRLREVSFVRKIQPFENITKAEAQRSTNHDTLVVIKDIEPNSRASAMTLRGSGKAMYVRGSRYEIPFWSVGSAIYEKLEEELYAYEMPITKIIEDNTVKEIQAIEDREGLRHYESAVQAVQEGISGVSGNLLSGSLNGFNSSNIRAGLVDSISIAKGELALQRTTDDFVALAPQRGDLITLINLLDGRHRRCERILMTEVDWNHLCRWTVDDFGDRLESETVVDGYKYSTLFGRKIIRTIKNEILRVGNMYAFTTPDFLGHAYILQDTKFYIEKRRNLISWQSWEIIAIGIGNIASIAKLELYSGSVTTGATDTGFAAKLPLSEDDLALVYNRADDGLTFPRASSF